MQSIETFAIVLAALAAGSIIKGATGLGLPIVALPVLAWVYDVPHAVAILALPIVATNLLQIRTSWTATRQTAFLIPMMGFGFAGIGFGTWLLTMLPPDALSVCLGLLLLCYIGLRIFNPTFALATRTGLLLAPPLGFAAGVMQGATGLCAAVGVPFIHSLGLARRAMIFAVSVMFLGFAIVQTALLLTVGLIQPHHLAEGALAMIPVAIFMPLGSWLGKRMNRMTFDRVFLAILATIGLGLVRDGVLGLL